MLILPITEQDFSWLTDFFIEHWGSNIIIVHQGVFSINALEGFTAKQEDDLLGVITFVIAADTCEIVTINSLSERQGIGTALVVEVIKTARQRGCRRIILTTTNDNMPALAFFQKRGFHLTDIRPGAVDEARFTKPEIPFTGVDGIPIHDELDLEFNLELPPNTG